MLGATLSPPATSTPFLIGDLGLDDEAADAVRKGSVSRLSAEVKESPPDGCNGQGYTLVRVALLGFAPPALKQLKALPKPIPNPDPHSPWPWILPNVELFHAGEFPQVDDSTGEQYTFECTDEDIQDLHDNFHAFASGERPTLEPKVAIGHTKNEAEIFSDDGQLAHGQVLAVRNEDRPIEQVETTTPKSAARFSCRRFSDSQRIFMFSDLAKGTAMLDNLDPATMDMGTDTGADDGTMAVPSREESIQWLTENGFDPVALKVDDSTSEEDLANLVEALKAVSGGADATFSDMPSLDMGDEEQRRAAASQAGTEGAAVPPGAAPLRNFSDRVLREVHMLRRELKQTNQAIEAVRRNGRMLDRNRQLEGIRTFCDQMVRERKISPADAEGPSREVPRGGKVYARLVRALGDTRTHRFSEVQNGKRVQRTQTSLEMEMDEIRSSEVRRFSEQMSRGKGAGSEVKDFDQRQKDYYAEQIKRQALKN